MPNGGCYTGWTGQLLGLVENHVFSPKEIQLAAGQKIRIKIDNRDDASEEFDSETGDMLGNFPTENVAGEVLQGVAKMQEEYKTQRELADKLLKQYDADLAKLRATEMVAFVVDTAQQLHGGYGYTRALPLERMARDARILRIYEGASEIQRTISARSVLGAR